MTLQCDNLSGELQDQWSSCFFFFFFFFFSSKGAFQVKLLQKQHLVCKGL